MQHHGQGDLEREGSIWGLQLQRAKFMPMAAGKCSIMTGAGSWEWTGRTHGFWNLQGYQQRWIFSSKNILPKPAMEPNIQMPAKRGWGSGKSCSGQHSLLYEESNPLSYAGKWLETKEKREGSGVGQLSGVEAVACILVQEERTQFVSFLTLQGPDEDAGKEHCGPLNRKARVFWTMCCGPHNDNSVVGKGQAIRKHCRHGGKGRQANGWKRLSPEKCLWVRTVMTQLYKWWQTAADPAGRLIEGVLPIFNSFSVFWGFHNKKTHENFDFCFNIVLWTSVTEPCVFFRRAVETRLTKEDRHTQVPGASACQPLKAWHVLSSVHFWTCSIVLFCIVLLLQRDTMTKETYKSI